jgi:hypothetical protein
MRFKYEAIQEHEGKAGGEERYTYSASYNELEAIISVINLKIEEEYSLSRQDILQGWVYSNFLRWSFYYSSNAQT